MAQLAGGIRHPKRLMAPIDASSQDIEIILNKHLKTCCSMSTFSSVNRISPNYLRDSGTVLRAWLRFALQSDLSDSDSFPLWIRSLNVKPATIAAYAFTLRQFFDWSVKHGLRNDNPAVSLDLPRVQKPFRKTFVSCDTVRTLIDECRDLEIRYCLYAGFHAGLRFSEVVASRPEWFSIHGRVLSVLRSDNYDTKDHTDRDIPLTDQFMSFLAVYGFPSPFMIAPHKLCAIRHRYRFDFSNRFENYVRSRNVKITFHDCRRTFASLHVSAGTSVYKVAKWLGDDVDVVQRHYGFLQSGDTEINRAFAA